MELLAIALGLRSARLTQFSANFKYVGFLLKLLLNLILTSELKANADEKARHSAGFVS